jgi:hypothetical protein
MMLFVVIVSLLGTGAILGLIYLFCEIVRDMATPLTTKDETPSASKLKFKKPNL